MAKIEQILRIKYIEDFLRSKKGKGASYEEIYNYLARKYADKDIKEDNLKFTKRTFLRDKKAIFEILNTEIVYRRSTNTYVIETYENEELEEDVFDNLLLVEAYKTVNDKKEIMLFEKRKSRGLEHLNGILHAIQNKKIISLHYTKYWEDEGEHRVLEPYALKEFRNRWYLLANDRDGKEFLVKTFGLDRISNLEISNSTFKKEKFNPNEAFQNSFGIISTANENPEEIILAFTPHQGKYIKSLPLHSSQKILIDDENELKIKLNIVPTFDFEQELLQHSEHLTIISPKSFKNRMEEIWKSALEK